MNQKEQLEIIEKINKQGINLLISKGSDYSQSGDILKNFKEVQQMCVLLGVDISKIEGVHMFYIILKIQRICNLMFSGKAAKNESIQDTLIDLRNYVDLLNCTIEENKK